MESSEGIPIFTEKYVGVANTQQTSNGGPQLPEVEALLQINQTFQSSDEAFTTYKLYARLSGFAARIQRCYRKKGDGGEIARKDFVCYRSNTPNTLKNTPDDNRQRRNRKSSRCKCPANLRVALVNNDGVVKWHVTRFENAHNHDMLTANEVRHLRCHRYISDHCKSRISELAGCNISVRQILSVIASEQGVSPSALPFNSKDVHNYIGSMKRQDRADDASNLILTCLKLQQNDPDFRFEYEVDAQNRLMHIAWSHATSYRAYQNYGDVVLFDTTYKLNVYDMPVGIWVGISNFGSSCFFGCCLLRDEKTVSFEWAFKAFLKLMNGKAPVSIMTDQDLAMKDAIRTVFPRTKHGLCMWHIAKKFPSHMRSLLKDRYDAWKDSFWALTRIETVEQFDSRWVEHLYEFGLQTNDHMRDLYEERDKWASAFVRSHFFAGLSTTGRSEAMNASLKRFVKKQVNLSDFMSQVTGVVGMMDYNGEFMMTKQNVDNIKLLTPHPIEKQAAELFTPYAFAKYQAQIIASFSYGAFIVDIGRGLWLVRHMEKSSGGRYVYHVTTDSIQCSCKMYEYEGLLCRHALAVLQRCNAFETPKDYIPFRWTRHASVRLPSMGTGVEHVRSQTEQLQYITNQLMKEASTSEQKHMWIMENLSKLLQQSQTHITEGSCASHSASNPNTSMHPTELPLTLNGQSAIFPIMTPPTSIPKGRKKTKRIRGILESSQRPRQCRHPGCGSTSHDRRNCPLMHESGLNGHPTKLSCHPQSDNDDEVGTTSNDSFDSGGV